MEFFVALLLLLIGITFGLVIGLYVTLYKVFGIRGSESEETKPLPELPQVVRHPNKKLTKKEIVEELSLMGVALEEVVEKVRAEVKDDKLANEVMNHLKKLYILSPPKANAGSSP